MRPHCPVYSCPHPSVLPHGGPYSHSTFRGAPESSPGLGRTYLVVAGIEI